MWIYIAHNVKLTFNALVTPVLTKQDCFEELFETHASSLSLSGSEFQTVGPATGKVRWPYVLSRRRGTMSRGRFAVVDVEMQLRWLGWCARQGTEVLVHADHDTSWGRAWSWPSQAHPASAVCHGVSTDHDQISSCRWLLGRRRWALVAACQWSSSELLHR